MGYFATQTETIDLGGGNTVTVRKLTYGEVLALSEDPRWEKTSGLVTTEKALVSWDGPGFDGREPTPDNLRALPFSLARKIAAAADKLTYLSEDEGNASGVATN